MRILILGGTLFLGRHLAAEAAARGYEVTLFHRGQTGADLFPGATRLLGDRDGDLGALNAGSWDAVIDTSGYLPGVVGRSAEALAAKASAYVFISSISVYPDFTVPGIDETAPVGILPPDAPRDRIVPGNYGPMKALCELAAEAAFGSRTICIRPGLIVGPYDPTDRFTYWVRRLSTPGNAILPGDGRRLVQFIDARDLAMFTLDLAERGEGGTFNVTGRPTPIGDLIAVADKTLARQDRQRALPVWVSEAFLDAEAVQSWTDLPLWISGRDQTVAIARAEDAGLKFRPPAETFDATLVWDDGRARAMPMKAGLAAEREASLLEKWRRHLAEERL